MENNSLAKLSDELQVMPSENLKVQTVIGNNAPALAEILMGNIKKVQADPKYIPQAQEVASQVRELVSLAKVEIDMYRVAQEMSKRR